MADTTLMPLGPASFLGDQLGIIDAADVAAVPDNKNGRAALKFADGSDEAAAVSQPFVVPSVYGGTNDLKVKLFYFGASAPGANNKVDWEVAFEAVTQSDAHDLEGGGDYFAAAQAVTDTIDANAGELNLAEITFTNAQADGAQAGDLCRVCVRRDSNDATNDTYADAVWLQQVEILDVQP